MEQFDGVIDSALWKQPEHWEELQKNYIESQPYQHQVLYPLCDREFLKNVHEEITSNMKANFKETDLFKVFQTAELGSLEEDSLQKEMPHLLRLRKVLYSKEFRDIIAKITNCREDRHEILTDRVDCSINAYANSCHLLCHDDVIGTRCVSYIIYFPNPDEEWKSEDGGAVELYPLDPASIVTKDDGSEEQGIPSVNPTKCILPIFNSMMVFKVQPGKSYHSVQEVFNKSSPRLSISGWYHAAQPPIGSDNSSLKLIMKYGDEKQSVQPLPPLHFGEQDSEEAFTTEEKTFLQQFIANEYLHLKNIKKLQKQFIKNSSIRLQQFLRKDLFQTIQSKIVVQDHQDQLGKGKPSLNYEIGAQDGWDLVGPSHKQRFLSFHPTNERKDSSSSSSLAEIGNHFHKIQAELFSHPAFVKFLSLITTIEQIKGFRSEIRRFRPGLDYTVAHYGIITREPWLDMTLTFVNDDKELEEEILRKFEAGKSINDKKRKKEKATKLKSLKKKQAKQSRSDDADEEEEANSEDGEDYASDYGDLWEDGDVGGFECFIEADDDADDAEAAEVYRQKKDGEEGAEDDTTLLSLSAYSNSLSLVLRDEGIMKFVKYVSANAPGSRWDVAVEYAIEQSQESENDEDENEEAESDDSEEDDEEDEEN